MSDMAYWDMYNQPINYFPMERDGGGNAMGMNVPSYNQIGSDDSVAVQNAKQQAQNRQYQQQQMNDQQRNQLAWLMNQRMFGQQGQEGQQASPYSAVAQILGALLQKKYGGEGLNPMMMMGGQG